MKWSYLVSLGLFEAGSLICALAPNSMTLIIGRAVAGLGSAGILTGSFVVVSHAVPLKTRPVWTAVVGLMYEISHTSEVGNMEQMLMRKQVWSRRDLRSIIGRSLHRSGDLEMVFLV